MVRRRRRVVAALNGVLGDHLEATGNALATPMSFRTPEEALTLEPGAITRHCHG